MKYKYWNPGEKLPVNVSSNVEYFNTLTNNWVTEYNAPAMWTVFQRRWISRMDDFDDLLIRACKKTGYNKFYRFKRILSRKYAIDTKYISYRTITRDLWEIIFRYNLTDAKNIVTEFERPLYESSLTFAIIPLARKGEFDTKEISENVLKSFIIARTIIRFSLVDQFPDISTPAIFRNKY